MATDPTRFTFNRDTHEYRLGANVVPGVTGILTSGGLTPFSFVQLDVLERKGALGKEVHAASHLDNLGTLGRMDIRVEPYVVSWRLFKKHVKFKLISSEYQTVAEIAGMHYGMQADSNAMVDGADTVIELKIGAVFPHHGVQLAGYAAGLPHPRYTAPLARFMARKRIVVQLRPNELPKVHTFADLSDYEMFRSGLYVTSWKMRHQNVYKEKA